MLITVLILLAVLTGLGFVRGSDQHTFIELTLYPEGAGSISYVQQIDCAGIQARACAELEANPELFVPAHGDCKPTMERPEVAVVRGLLAGREIDLRVERRSACGEATWNRLITRLLLIPASA